jgi:hypothetical protein
MVRQGGKRRRGCRQVGRNRPIDYQSIKRRELAEIDP